VGETSSDGADSTTETIRWRVFLLAEQPWRGGLALVALAVCMVWVYRELDSVAATILAGVFLVLTLRRFLLPVAYLGDCDGLLVREYPGERRYPWRRFRRVQRQGRWLLLSPFSRPRPLDAWRGLRLLLPAGERADELERWISRRLQARNDHDTTAD
jgi:hypothetical protein